MAAAELDWQPGVFARHAPEYLAHGLACFPVDPRAKKPAVRHWQQATPRASRAWARDFPNTAGLGINMGVASGITEIDVDAVGGAALAAAVERYGESSIVIQTASGKHKLWYRHAGEQRLIRPVPGEPVDVLGAGFTIAPPSEREDLGAAYRFVRGGLEDIGKLPAIRPGALYGGTRLASQIHQGERNGTLFRWCMREARHCDDAADLIDAAATWADAMPSPLPAREIEKTAISAWKYETEGRNFIGMHRPIVTENDKNMDMLADAPDAYFLLGLFQRFHTNRGDFAIAPAAMAASRNPPWGPERIRRARSMLVRRGLLIEVAAPDARKRKAGRYRLPPAGKA